MSVRDVAEAARVSIGTVSAVLNQPDKVAPATVERVQAAIAWLGYVRNDAARQLRVGRSRAIGMVVLDASNPFFAAVIRGAEQRAGDDRLSVLLGNSGEKPDREKAYLELFRDRRVHGVLITSASDNTERLQSLREAGIPIVIVGAEPSSRSYSSVTVDDVEGGYIATSHLLRTGRRRLAFVGGPLFFTQVARRLQGARMAVDEEPGARLEVVELPALTALHGRTAGERIAERVKRVRPDGIFAANDLLAVGLLQGLTKLGSSLVPEEISLIGYDDIDFASATAVPLSTIHQPAEKMGWTAVDLLLKSIADPRGDYYPQVRFRPTLVVRESTTPSRN